MTEEDAYLARKNWFCLSCDRKLEPYRGKIGNHMVNSHIKAKLPEQEVIGGGMLFRNKSKYELPQFKKWSIICLIKLEIYDLWKSKEIDQNLTLILGTLSSSWGCSVGYVRSVDRWDIEVRPYEGSLMMLLIWCPPADLDMPELLSLLFYDNLLLLSFEPSYFSVFLMHEPISVKNRNIINKWQLKSIRNKRD